MILDDIVRVFGRAVTCAACGRKQFYPYGRGTTPMQRNLGALRAALRDGWRPTSNGPVCSHVCAMRLAKDVTPCVCDDSATGVATG